MHALLQRRACDTSSRNVATRCHAREAQRARRVSNTREEGALHWSSRGAAWFALVRKFDETNFCSQATCKSRACTRVRPTYMYQPAVIHAESLGRTKEREHNVCKPWSAEMASRAERDALNLQEVRDFLSRIGLKQCTDSILNDGLYISMSLLRYATYKELLECKGITPVQAVTVLTSLGATAPRMDASTAELLNAAGVEAGIDALAYAGCTSIRALRGKTLDQLVLLGLPPEQAERLCSSLTFVDDSGHSLLVSATLEPSAESAADERSQQAGLQAFPVPAPSEMPADAEVASAPARTTSAKSVAERIGLDPAFYSSDEDDRPKPWPKHEYEDDDEDDRPKDEVEDDLIGRRAKSSREKPRLKPILLVAVWLLVATLVSGGLFVYATSASGRSAPVLLLSVDTPNATEPAGATGGHRGKGRGKGSGRGMKRKGATASSGRRRNVTWAMEI